MEQDEPIGSENGSGYCAARTRVPPWAQLAAPAAAPPLPPVPAAAPAAPVAAVPPPPAEAVLALSPLQPAMKATAEPSSVSASRRLTARAVELDAVSVFSELMEREVMLRVSAIHMPRVTLTELHADEPASATSGLQSCRRSEPELPILH